MELEKIIHASQMLSAETDPQKLFAKMVGLMMSYSGAEKTILLMKREKDWFIRAMSNDKTEKQEVRLNELFDPASKNNEEISIPARVFKYCQRSMDAFIVGNALLDGRFSNDKTIQKYKIKSIACIPFKSRGEQIGLIYLENRKTANVFTHQGLEILKHLIVQFAISMENALRYEQLSNQIRELQDNESVFRSFVENSDEAIVVTQDDAVKYCNRQVTELSGYSREEICLRNFHIFIHPEDLEMVLREYRDRLSGEKMTGNYSMRIITRDKQVKHVRVNSVQVDWKGKPATLGLLRDITDLKRVERDIKKNEERFKKLIEQSPFAIEILTPEGTIQNVNPAWNKLWGVSEDQAKDILKKYNMLTDRQAKDLGIMPLIEKAFAGEHVVLPPVQYSGNRATEQVGLKMDILNDPWIQCYLYPVRDENGKILYVVNMYMELTKIKQAEQEVIKQKELLARMSRTSRMGQLAGSITHELSQPLTGILSNAQALEMILKKNYDESDEKIEIVGDIIADAKRSGNVIRGLRELYREQKGQLQPANINTIVDETIQLLHSELILQRTVVHTVTAPSVQMVNGNLIQLQQVLINLIMNGIQAMTGLAQNDRHLRIVITQEAKEVKVCVEDRGPGIPADKINHIFEPLATWKPGGTGMGLAISNSIIEMHGGKMWAENIPEGGARVGFLLPVLKEGQDS
jgi:PAS domain S-box-containing protein